MGLALALIVMGVLLFMDRMGTAYGLREGWPWIVIALGVGGLLKNIRSFAGWLTTVIGIFILGTKYYSIHITVPGFVKTFFLPILLILVGILWLVRHKKD
jgi:hypothetical protein